MDIITNSKIDWNNQNLISVLNELKESNIKISNILQQDNLIKIISHFNNRVRYDLISKNEIITYNVPEVFGCLFA